ncbi:MAG: RNA polymerase subunit sigma-24, partial [Flavisolibacter sp.]|nr:RNA polymerase subunit sigma-24 [Flavisolibacter sp.]
ILKEAFDYSHDEISSILSITEENSRKLLSRAKNKLSDFKSTDTKFSYDSTIAEKYYALIKNGDVQALEKLLAEEVSLTADGGGKVKVVREFLQGKRSVAELLLFAYDKFQRPLTPKFTEINHQPALLYYHDKTVMICQVLETDDTGKVSAIYSILDPDKLKNLP